MRTIGVEKDARYFNDTFAKICMKCPHKKGCREEECFLYECTCVLCGFPSGNALEDTSEETAMQIIQGMADDYQIGHSVAYTILKALKARIASGTNKIDGIPYCPKCFKPVGLDAKFCQNCGQKLREE